jgi:Protein of unknown function (DUF3592)
VLHFGAVSGLTSPPNPAESKTLTGVRDLVLWMTNNPAKVFHFMCYLQIGCGLILLATGWYVGKTQIHLIREGTRTPGLIVDYEKHYNRGRRTSAIRSVSYMPVVEYHLGDRAIRFEDWLGKSLPGALNYPVGVLYDDANPAVAMIDRPLWNWLPWCPMMALGAFLLLAGIASLLRSPA